MNEHIAQADELLNQLVFDQVADAMTCFDAQFAIDLDVNIGEVFPKTKSRLLARKRLRLNVMNAKVGD